MYDANGRKTRQVQKEKESDPDTSAYYVVSFNYDSRDMLVEEKYQRWDSGNSAWENMYWARYAYDTAGNMVERRVNQIVDVDKYEYVDSSFYYSRGYQLTSFMRFVDSGSETRAFTLTYDANGNMTHIEQSATFTDTFYNITEMEFQFDAKNRMTHYRFGGSGSYCEIKYDALGRVRERVNLTPTTTKYYSDGRQLIQQLDDSDDVQFDYFRGPTGLMRQVDVDDSNKKRFYIKDPLGTVLALVNPSDLSVEHYNYNAWGEHLDKDDTGFPTDENLMRYIGCRVEAFGNSTAQTDAIYHLQARHYLPSVNTFAQRDPLRFFSTPHAPRRMSLNAYMYCENAPVNKLDPTGLTSCQSAQIAGGMVHGCYYNDCTFAYGSGPAEGPPYECDCGSLSSLFLGGSLFQYNISIVWNQWPYDCDTYTTQGILHFIGDTGWSGSLCDFNAQDLPLEIRARPFLCCWVADECFCKSCMDQYSGPYREHPFFLDLTLHTNANQCSQFAGCLLPYLMNRIYHYHYSGNQAGEKLSFYSTCAKWKGALIGDCTTKAEACGSLWDCVNRMKPLFPIGEHNWIDIFLKSNPALTIPLDVVGAWSEYIWPDWWPGQWYVTKDEIYKFILNHMHKHAKW